ncbi:MAG: class I SAM-dependent methyltransferase [Pseudomonadales bacterium]|nr:class I SAM-dependent methyltransferase [Pseudomonadales bacterium]
MSETNYDLLPYKSYPFAVTCPENLASIATLFGMQPPDFRCARVLELGCASGGNIIPLAELYPDSEFTGIDLSSKEIGEGLEQIAATDLHNIKLQAMSVADIDAAFGKFDYIIAHGLFSWVPYEVQEHILRICKENLVENGVAFVSFNTLPGWNLVNSVRGMMQYHTESISDPQEKANQARLILQFMIDGLEGDNSLHAQLMREEMELLSGKEDYYLLHDHLEDDNHPIYFHEFMQRARTAGLDFLGDTDLHTMLVDNLPPSVSAHLRKLTDMVQSEQYMDFFRNRRFRNTLLCHQGVPLNRNITPQTVERFYVSTDARCATEINESTLAEGFELSFTLNKIALSTKNRLSKLVFIVLVEQSGRPLALDDIVAKVLEKAPDISAGQIRQHIFNELSLIGLVFKGILKLRLSPGVYLMAVPEKPKTTRTARYLAEKGDVVTSCRHQLVSMQEIETIILKLLDGTRTVDEVAAALLEQEKQGLINITANQANVDKATLIRDTCQEVIARFCKLAFLV